MHRAVGGNDAAGSICWSDDRVGAEWAWMWVWRAAESLASPVEI